MGEDPGTLARETTTAHHELEDRKPPHTGRSESGGWMAVHRPIRSLAPILMNVPEGSKSADRR
jgi:hypothetical protein